jgi:hypothetical protein
MVRRATICSKVPPSCGFQVIEFSCSALIPAASVRALL